MKESQEDEVEEEEEEECEKMMTSLLIRQRGEIRRYNCRQT